MNRFFLKAFTEAKLVGTEAYHATQVLRVKVGDTVNVFDGHGQEAQGQVLTASREAVVLKLLSKTKTQPLNCRVTLAQAIPKKNMDLIVQKATELGVWKIQPIVSERTQVQLDEDSKKLDRWREIAMESCKQCGNNWLPEVEAPKTTREFLASLASFDLKLIGSLQPGARKLKSILADQPKPPLNVLVMIGPEGDFTPAEMATAQNAGCLPLTLGPLVLRADTAAIYGLSILHHEIQVGC